MTDPDFADARQQMVHTQLRGRGIHDENVLAAMGRVPREKFVAPRTVHQAYADRALPIGSGQTISQPYIVALMSQALECSSEHLVLEIGTGSGYQTAVLAEIAREVISIERYAELS
jgi:protein-L-isoaspartate(D-aspartate) O-methyltransferase